jgi:hypothetical protein
MIQKIDIAKFGIYLDYKWDVDESEIKMIRYLEK